MDKTEGEMRRGGEEGRREEGEDAEGEEAVGNRESVGQEKIQGEGNGRAKDVMAVQEECGVKTEVERINHMLVPGDQKATPFD